MDQSFPSDPKLALQRSFLQAESEFIHLRQALCIQGKTIISGSAALVVLFVDDVVYIATVGDSRAILSQNCGKEFVKITNEHKAYVYSEASRILRSRSQNEQVGSQQTIGLTRCIGCIQDKDPTQGGQQNVIIPMPDVKSFQVQKSHDFIFLANGSIFEKQSNQDLIQSILGATLQNSSCSLHERCGKSVDAVFIRSVQSRVVENLTAIIIGFQGFERLLVQLKEIPTPVEIFYDWESLENEAALLQKEVIYQPIVKPLESVEEVLSDIDSPSGSTKHFIVKQNSKLELPLIGQLYESNVCKSLDSSQEDDQCGRNGRRIRGSSVETLFEKSRKAIPSAPKIPLQISPKSQFLQTSYFRKNKKLDSESEQFLQQLPLSLSKKKSVSKICTKPYRQSKPHVNSLTPESITLKQLVQTQSAYSKYNNFKLFHPANKQLLDEYNFRQKKQKRKRFQVNSNSSAHSQEDTRRSQELQIPQNSNSKTSYEEMHNSSDNFTSLRRNQNSDRRSIQVLQTILDQKPSEIIAQQSQQKRKSSMQKTLQQFKLNSQIVLTDSFEKISLKRSSAGRNASVEQKKAFGNDQNSLPQQQKMNQAYEYFTQYSGISQSQNKVASKNQSLKSVNLSQFLKLQEEQQVQDKFVKVNVNEKLLSQPLGSKIKKI